ncbi:MAG: FkbM family methyltransferase [Myxococcaceae bacterium]|nr:FkbM family methyltransferase [Myxococcaceae bacterium]
MLSLVNVMRDAAAHGLRSAPWLPQHRGLRRRLNDWFLTCGASPEAIAPLQSGVRIKLDLRALSQRDAFYLGHYDREYIASCTCLLDEGCVVLDVGANVGLTLLPLATRVKALHGHIHAFEPVHENLVRLRANIALNQLESVSSAWPFGLSSQSSSAQISLREDFLAGGRTGNASLVIDVSEGAFATETIELRALDQFARQTSLLARLDLIKVDIEGHEDYFLEGARDTLDKYRPVVAMEVNKTYYGRRGVDLDERLRQVVPDYQMLVSAHGLYRNWRVSESINECKRLDNVLLVPRERLEQVQTRLRSRRHGTSKRMSLP